MHIFALFLDLSFFDVLLYVDTALDLLYQSFLPERILGKLINYILCVNYQIMGCGEGIIWLTEIPGQGRGFINGYFIWGGYLGGLFGGFENNHPLSTNNRSSGVSNAMAGFAPMPKHRSNLFGRF